MSDARTTQATRYWLTDKGWAAVRQLEQQDTTTNTEENQPA